MELEKAIHFINELLDIKNENIKEDLKLINYEIDKEIVTEKKNNTNESILIDKDSSSIFVLPSSNNFSSEKKKLYDFIYKLKGISNENIHKLFILYNEKKFQLKKKDIKNKNIDEYIIKREFNNSEE